MALVAIDGSDHSDRFSFVSQKVQVAAICGYSLIFFSKSSAILMSVVAKARTLWVGVVGCQC